MAEIRIINQSGCDVTVSDMNGIVTVTVSPPTTRTVTCYGGGGGGSGGGGQFGKLPEGVKR